MQTHQKWEWKIESKCICIRCNALVEKNLQEASELIANDNPGLQKGIDIIIDGDNLFDRLIELKIDEDILYKQFSVIKFQKIIEDSILRKSKKCIIAFSKDNRHNNKELISRLEAEGTQVVILEDRLHTIDFIYEQAKRVFELVLVSSNKDIADKISLEKDNCYLYTISFKNDLPTHSVPIFFSKGDITIIGLNHCFNYKECRKVNIKSPLLSPYSTTLSCQKPVTFHISSSLSSSSPHLPRTPKTPILFLLNTERKRGRRGRNPLFSRV